VRFSFIPVLSLNIFLVNYFSTDLLQKDIFIGNGVQWKSKHNRFSQS